MKKMKKEFSVEIVIRKSRIELRLLRGADFEVVDKIAWEDSNNLSLNLLANIDNLLKKNKVKKEQLNNIDVDSDQTTYSSTRIARTVAEAGRYCLTN